MTRAYWNARCDDCGVPRLTLKLHGKRLNTEGNEVLCSDCWSARVRAKVKERSG